MNAQGVETVITVITVIPIARSFAHVVASDRDQRTLISSQDGRVEKACNADHGNHGNHGSRQRTINDLRAERVVDALRPVRHVDVPCDAAQDRAGRPALPYGRHVALCPVKRSWALLIGLTGGR